MALRWLPIHATGNRINWDAVCRFERYRLIQLPKNLDFSPSSPPSKPENTIFLQLIMERIQYLLVFPKPENHVGCPGLLYEVQIVWSNQGREEDRHGQRADAYGGILLQRRLHRQNLEDHCLNV